MEFFEELLVNIDYLLLSFSLSRFLKYVKRNQFITGRRLAGIAFY